jgi:hypothetical protein
MKGDEIERKKERITQKSFDGSASQTERIILFESEEGDK